MLNKKEVIKHSAAIQISNEISLLQRKAWNVLLANAFNDLPYTDVYEISIKDLGEILKFDSKNADYLKQSLKILNATQVEWNILRKDGRQDWGVFTLLSQANIINGICYYSYAPYLKNQLHNPIMYAKINLRLQNRFKSKHALALYELFIDYYRIKDECGETPFIELDDFRKLLGLKDGDYPKFKILSRDIIKKSLKEINKKSDLFVKSEYKKDGRKIIAIKFSIKKNPKNTIDIEKIANKTRKNEQQSLPIPEFDIDNQKLFKILRNEFGISKNKAAEILKAKDEFYVYEVLDAVRAQIDAGKVQNIPAFTVKAIENDYRSKKPEAVIEKEKKQEQKKKVTEGKNIVEDLTRAFNAQFEAKVDEKLNGLPENDKKDLIREFEQEKIEKNSIIRKSYLKNGLESHVVLPLFKSYIAHKLLPDEESDFVAYAASKGYKLEKEIHGGYKIVE